MSTTIITIASFVSLVLTVTCEDWSSSTCQNLPDDPTDYVVKDSEDGGLAADDDFAVQAVCHTNRYRQEAAGLGGVTWNAALAAFASKWTQQLIEKDCSMQHSSSADRSNIPGYTGYAGENIAWSWSSQDIDESTMSKHGRLSVEGWYSEMKYYQYGGASESFNSCPMRNDDGRAQTGHLTQLLWHSITDMGCDWGLCSDGSSASTIVVCVFGPGGNMMGEAAFDEAAYEKLNAWPENVEKYGGLPKC